MLAALRESKDFSKFNLRRCLINNRLLLAIAAIAFIATPVRAEVSVILECILQGAKESNHDLYEIDYDARIGAKPPRQ